MRDVGVTHARVPGLKELVLAHGGRDGVDAGPEVRSEGQGEGGVGAERVGLDGGFVEDEGCEKMWVEEGEVGSGEWCKWWWWWCCVVKREGCGGGSDGGASGTEVPTAPGLLLRLEWGLGSGLKDGTRSAGYKDSEQSSKTTATRLYALEAAGERVPDWA